MTKEKSAQLPAEISPERQRIIDQLKASQPMEDSFQRVQFPRLGMYSQDQTEGEGKDKKVTITAGTFFIENESDEVDENGKKKWVKDEIGNSAEVTIVYNRHQLKMYNEDTEEFTSSPIYDTQEDVIPLFLNKKEVARGTPEELKAKYEYQVKDKTTGKTRTKSYLQDNRIVYAIYEGTIHQMNLGGTSMYSFLKYLREVKPTISAVRTALFSEYNKNGKIEWNKMTFAKERDLTDEELAKSLDFVEEFKAGIEAEKSFFRSKDQNSVTGVPRLDSGEGNGLSDEDTRNFE